MEINILFDPKQHRYLVNGKEATSVTKILQEVGISESFDDKPQIVLDRVKKAADRGNYYDKMAESAIKSPYELNDWQTRFLEFLTLNKIKITRTQVRVGALHPLIIAGSPDLIGEIEINGKIYPIIIDLKATFNIYLESVTWQTNMYSWMDELTFKLNKHNDTLKYVLHYDEKTDKFTLMKLKHIPEEQIMKMLETYMLGEKYTNWEIVLGRKFNIQTFSETYDKVAKYKKLLQEEEEKIKEFEENIMKAMAEANVKTIELENYKITYTPPGIRKNVSYQKIANNYRNLLKKLEVFEEVLDEIVEENTSETNIKARLTITEK